jgi:endonuclease YncB( thermonuclease family)
MRVGPMPAWAGGARRPRRHLPRWLLPAVVLLLAAVVTWLLSPLPPDGLPGTVAGKARVHDGDTLGLTDPVLGAVRVRLDGMDAPELAQTCLDAAGQSWACGMAAQRELSRLAEGRMVRCETLGYDRYGRVLADCAVGADGLGAALVLAGLAVAEGRYAGEERRARDAKTGIWAGGFERPAAWRRAHPRADAEPDRPSVVTSLLNWVGNVFFR